MPESQTQSLEGSTEASSCLQLLSPRAQQSIQDLTSKISSSKSADYFEWNTIPSIGETLLGTNAEGRSEVEESDHSLVEFDFNEFTLASVSERKKEVQQDATGTSFDWQSSVSQINSIDCVQPLNRTADCAIYYDDYISKSSLSRSMSSVIATSTTENFAMSQRQRQHLSSKDIQRASSRSCLSGEDSSRSRFQMSSTAASAGFPMAKKKELTAVVMRGWLQKRKGRVLKRWKPYYCLWKNDDILCLYASEDTVNGRLEQRYQVLQVVLTDKNDSFHIICVDSDSAPRREEFRVLISTEWIHWFQVLGRFFDKSSLVQARLSKPGLVCTKLLNEAEDSSWLDYNSDVDLVTNGILPKDMTYDSYDGCHRYSSQSKQSAATVCDSYDGSGYDKMSTPSFSESSASSNQITKRTQHNSSEA
ncbi:unnamed protein product [Peronospora destructor]|uniref:PH domain-containing protein n=1 Tax=Peronospora destructor TaxID=86335 RepID=A0AAV0T354_9STRA|nr:unnamed protein product [Peronospora destructor]